MISLNFQCKTLPEDTFQVLSFNGEEEISHCFQFDLCLLSRDPNIDFKIALEGGAVLCIQTQKQTRYIQGMLAQFELVGEHSGDLYEYRARLVPRLWMMSQSKQNQIFQNQDVGQIIENELTNIDNKGNHPLASIGLEETDFEFHLTADYEPREYTGQYKESDFNFISR